MLDLKPEYVAIIDALLAQYVPDMTVWAYGSRVQGTAHTSSDVDLVIRNPKDLTQPQKNLMSLRSAFRDSILPITVDVQDWARIPVAFQEEIERQHIEFRKKNLS